VGNFRAGVRISGCARELPGGRGRVRRGGRQVPAGDRARRCLGTGLWHSLALSDGSHLKADYYVFACGPCLGKLFPQAVGDLVQATKQDIFSLARLRGMIGQRTRICRLGAIIAITLLRHPRNDRRGFKIADDTRGPAFDPTNGERVVSPETLRDIREYVGFRFPA